MSAPLIPKPGIALPAAPYVCSDDGMISAADGTVLLVLGDPNEGLAEVHVTLGAAIRAIPTMVATLRAIELACAGLVNALRQNPEKAVEVGELYLQVVRALWEVDQGEALREAGR